MSRITKTAIIEGLQKDLEKAKFIEQIKDSEIRKLRGRLEYKDQLIESLYAENDALVHTPEFAADTEGAFDRGRNEGVRSLASTANNYMYAMAEDTVQAMNQIVNKYTRQLTAHLFLGTVLEEETVKDLPDTDFTKNLLENMPKIDMNSPEIWTEHSVVD